MKLLSDFFWGQANEIYKQNQINILSPNATKIDSSEYFNSNSAVYVIIWKIFKPVAIP